MKIQAGATPNGFGFPVHLAGLVTFPAGIRREIGPLQQGSAPVPWVVGLVLGVVEPRAPAWLGGSGCLACPPSPRAPGSSLPASSSSSRSRQREEEREGETVEPTQSKTRESKMRAVEGNADVLQAQSRLGKSQGEALSGTEQRRCCGPGPLRTHQGCASWPWLGVQATWPAAHLPINHPWHPPAHPSLSPPGPTAAFPARQGHGNAPRTGDRPVPPQDRPISPGAK